MGQGVREPALHRDRRTAFLSRRLRQPSGQRAAPPEARVRILRIVAAVHLLLGDHRQSARAGAGAHRPAVRTGIGKRRAVRRKICGVLQSAGGEQSAGHPARVSERDPAHRARTAGSRPADAGVRQLAAGDRNSAHLFEGRPPRRKRPRLSRRLSAQGAARDRAQVARRRNPRRGGHQRAGTGHRHRIARRRGDGRLSRHHRFHLAARRTRRTPPDHGAGGAGGVQRAARSVHH